LGGGKSNFVRSDVNLAEAFKNDGYSYVTSKNELLNDENDKIVGLFADGGMPKMIDRTEVTPSLEEMTIAAIERLSKNDNGFFLMVEGSQIDWAGHANDVIGSRSEMEDFEKAFRAAIEFAKEDKHTLVVATADHSTGGFSIGADGSGIWDINVIKAVKRTTAFIAEEIANGTDDQIALLRYIEQDLMPLTAEEIDAIPAASEKADVIETELNRLIDKRSYKG